MNRSVLVGLALAALLGCDGGDLDVAAESVEQRQDSLYNSQNIFATIENPDGKRCSALFLRNQWALTTGNCSPDVGSHIEMYGTPIQTVDSVARPSTSGPWRLVRTSQPYDFWGTTTMYQARFFMGDLVELQGQKITCGTQTSVDVTVEWNNSSDRIYFSRANNVNLPFTADQGAVCWRKTTLGMELIGIVEYVSGAVGYAKLISGASPGLTGTRREILQHMYSGRLICHGPECYTTGYSLPATRFSTGADWDPCSKEVKRANGVADWTAIHNFLPGDGFWLHSTQYSGVGTTRGHLTHGGIEQTTVVITTNEYDSSPGLSSLFATCANVRVLADGAADGYSMVGLNAGIGRVTGTCGIRGAGALNGCGVVSGTAQRTTVECDSGSPSTRKVKEITVTRPYGANETYACTPGAKSCAASVLTRSGFQAYCTFVQ